MNNTKHTNNNVLVAIMNSKSDFEIAQTHHWYRIPVNVKLAPPIVKENKIKYIAFYHTQVFEIEKYSIQWYSQVNKISIVKRKELFTELLFDPKSEEYYYKIEFNTLIALPNPIISTRHRRILFIPTSEEKFFNSTEINYLFNDSPIEELLWKKFVEKQISAERQFYLRNELYRYVLDFAIFCKKRNINVECDSNKYHLNKNAVYRDKKRNNILASNGWAVLRFPSSDIVSDIDNTIYLVNKTIKRCGGASV